MNDKTCKHFHAIVESRQTWMRFIQETQSLPNISKIEEPVEDFTTQELRDWVLRRHKIRRSLYSGSRATCHYIRGTNNAQKIALLPGGRWLLLENSPGIFYADCDASCPKIQPLITFEDVVPDHIRTQFVVWRDPRSPRLTFRVAILHWYDRGGGDHDYQAHFCKIDLVGHGSSAKLVVEQLHLYQGAISRGETSGECIRGEYFYQVHGFCGSWASHLQPSLEILDYGNGSSIAKQFKFVDFNWFMLTWGFDILSDGRIASSGAGNIVIYPDPLPIIGNETKKLAPLHVIETIRGPLKGGRLSMSEWHLGPDSNMVVFGGQSYGSLIAVWVPHDGAPPMNRTIVKRMPHVRNRSTELGLFHGVTIISRDCINVFNYPWGDFQNEALSGRMTRQAFYIERDQDDGTSDIDDDASDIDDDASDIDDDASDIGESYQYHGMRILYFNEEFGRTIILDQDRGYFVIDIL